jgi:hypothetical protein
MSNSQGGLTMTLIKKWILITDDEHYSWNGEITATINKDHVLVRLRSNIAPTHKPSKIFSVYALEQALIFPDEDALDQWMTLASATECKIIPFVRR